MKKLLFFCPGIFLGFVGIGQINNPVKWDFKADKIDAVTYEIHYMATIPSPWHIYSQSTPEEGSSPTVISINKHNQIKSTGTIQESGKLISKHLDIIDVTIQYYEEKVDFVQKVKISGKLPVTMTGNIKYTACTEEKCLPAETVDFSIVLK